MKKLFTLIFLVALDIPFLSHGYELKSELPSPPMKCPDVLFKTFAIPSDPTLSGPLKLAYIYCICLEGLKEKRKNTSSQETKRIDQNIAMIERLLEPVLVSYSVGDFMFAHTNLRDLISKEMQTKIKNISK